MERKQYQALLHVYCQANGAKSPKHAGDEAIHATTSDTETIPSGYLKTMPDSWRNPSDPKDRGPNGPNMRAMVEITHYRPRDVARGWGDWDTFIEWQSYGRHIYKDMTNDREWSKEAFIPVTMVDKDGKPAKMRKVVLICSIFN